MALYKSDQAGVLRGVYIAKRLIQEWGLKDFQAAGFPGCFMAESRCDPKAYNKAEKSGRFKGSSANGSGYGAGLAQWSNTWKRSIQQQFNRYTPIESWTLDQQIQIVIRTCKPTFISMIKRCSSAAEATDIVLRGYENGGGGTGGLRSKQSMKAYTWCKNVYIADVGRRTFADGYIGALAERTAWANVILKQMGSVNVSDIENLGSIGGFDQSMGDNMMIAGSGPGGMQVQNQYPVHMEYETFSGTGGNIFEITDKNAVSQAAFADPESTDNRIDIATGRETHIRIYSTNDSKIVLDELAMPLFYNKDNYANKGIKGERERDNTARIEKGSGNANPSTNENTSTNKKEGNSETTDKKETTSA